MRGRGGEHQKGRFKMRAVTCGSAPLQQVLDPHCFHPKGRVEVSEVHSSWPGGGGIQMIDASKQPVW